MVSISPRKPREQGPYVVSFKPFMIQPAIMHELISLLPRSFVIFPDDHFAAPRSGQRLIRHRPI